MLDLVKLSKDDLKDIGVQKVKHRNAIIEELARMRDAKPCGVITLSATGAAARIHPKYLGKYNVIAGEEHEGAPVYRNSDGYYLYRYSDGTWHTNNVIGDYGAYRSVDNAQCPARVSQWQYAAGPSGYNSGDIKAQCSVHTQ